MTTICSRNNMAAKEANNISFALLVPSHHPSVVDLAPGFWKRMLKYIKVDCKKFITSYSKQIYKTFVEEYSANPVGYHKI